jgi:hypothetical protein
MLAKIQEYSRIKNKNNSRLQTPKLTAAERRQSLLVILSRLTTLLTEYIGFATIKEKMLLNNVNVHIRDPINYTTIKTFLLCRCLEAACL